MARYSRRGALRLLAWVGLWASPSKVLGSAAGSTAPLTASVHPLVRNFRHPESAAVVGAEYLRLRPREAEEWKLHWLLGLPDARANQLSVAEMREQAARFVARHRDDFRCGQVLNLDGWVLSVTELRLCALVCLSVRRTNPADSSFVEDNRGSEIT